MISSIIPVTESVIVIDTNLLRNLCYDEYEWVKDFENMSKINYQFCLPEHSLFEFIKHFLKKAISVDRFNKGIHQLSKFISPLMPILFSHKRLFQMTGISENVSNLDFDIDYWVCYSKAIWNYVTKVNNKSYFYNCNYTFKCNGNEYSIKPELSKVFSYFENEREDREWIKYIEEKKN